MFGTVSANAKTWPKLKETVGNIRPVRRARRHLSGAARPAHAGRCGWRGIRRSALEVARWFEQRPEVLRVLHPALESDPGHAIWKRDFSGASGLFSIVLKPAPEKAVHAFCDALTLFGMGFSWGGYESLVILFDCASYRTATPWAPGGPTLALPYRPGRYLAT